MKPTHLKAIAFGVLALAVVWAATALLPSGTDRAAADFRLADVTADSVDTIIVTASAETATIARSATGGWTVNGFAASSTAVAELFAVLRDTVRPELVARSTTSFARLGLDSAAARRVTIRGHGGTLLDLFVSDRGPAGGYGGDAYVRLPADSAAYAWSGRLGSVARRRVDDWRDRVIAAVVPESVRRVDVERGTRRYTLQRRDGGWAFAGSGGGGGGAADSSGVARLLDRFRSLNAGGFPTRAQLDSAFRGRGERRVTLFGPADSVLVTLDFDSTAGTFWVRRSAGATVYRVDRWEADQLAPHDSTLRRRAP